MTTEEVRECMSEYDVDNGKIKKYITKITLFTHVFINLISLISSVTVSGGVIEMSEFSLFIRNQAKEAERKLKVIT